MIQYSVTINSKGIDLRYIEYSRGGSVKTINRYSWKDIEDIKYPLGADYLILMDIVLDYLKINSQWNNRMNSTIHLINIMYGLDTGEKLSSIINNRDRTPTMFEITDSSDLNRYLLMENL